jgi:hypothetical protein
MDYKMMGQKIPQFRELQGKGGKIAIVIHKQWI